jgi:hypothetical protein
MHAYVYTQHALTYTWQDEAFDLLLAKVRAAVEKGIKSGDQAITSFERKFETKLRR